MKMIDLEDSLRQEFAFDRTDGNNASLARPRTALP